MEVTQNISSSAVVEKKLSRKKPLLWLVYGLASLIPIIVYFQLEGAAASHMYDAIGLVAGIMILVGVRVNRPKHKLPWLLIGVGQLLLVAGDIIWAYYKLVAHIAVPFPSTADALYLAAYPTMGAGILLLVHYRTKGRDKNALIDASCITIGLGILAWIFLMQPYAGDPALTALEKGISIAYPLGNIAILAVLTRLALSRMLRSPALRFLVTAFTLQLVADSIYGTQLLLTGDYAQGFTTYFTNGFWLSMYTLLAMAALHPSMKKVTEAAEQAPERSQRIRVAVLAVSLLLMPAAQTIQALRGLEVNIPVTVAASSILVLLIFVRMRGLVTDIEGKVTNLTRRDRELNELLIEREGLMGKLEHQAFHDSLTGVANRRLFVDRIDHARAATKRSGKPLSLLFIDLDDFKSINDELGHAAGDDLLAAVAERLTSGVRPSDTVGRIGGDEFAILLVDASAKDAAAASDRLLQDLKLPFPVEDGLITVQASVGVVSRMDGEIRTDELLKSADQAMYEAKRHGKGRYEFFDAELQDKLVKQQEMGKKFALALAGSELEVHYQPIIDLESGSLAGTEALLRWADPEIGNIPPSEFLPLAQEQNLMTTVDSFVLETAIAQLALWLPMIEAGDLQMNVNISPSKLVQKGFVEEVSEILQRFGVPASNLVLEITETDLMVDMNRVGEVLKGLKEIGVQLALDDFGTGYSSLSHIQRFPIDVLKIDKSFIDELGLTHNDGIKEVMTSVINSMGKSFRMVTVAEGVESVEQFFALRELKCPLAQGYLFARPAPPDQIEELVTGGRTALEGLVLPESLAELSKSPQ